MRLVLVLVVTIVFAWGLHALLTDDTPPVPSRLPERDTESEPEADRRPVTRTVTLALRVETQEGTVPPGTMAGYHTGGEDRLRHVDREGRVLFTDAPAGHVVLVARAPGYRRVEQERLLNAGLRTDARLVLDRRSP